MTLKEEVLEYRAKNGLSQRAFAEKVGVTLQTIWNLENDKVPTRQITETKIRLAMKEGK